MHKLHILPSQFLAMEEPEKAFVIAAIDIKADNDRRKERELQRKSKAKKGK